MTNFNEDEACACPTCDLINHYTNILVNADVEDFEYIVRELVLEAKDIANIELLVHEVQEKERMIDYLINGCDCEDNDLN